MFISNNSTSFHLWCKENFVKHQKVSKYYENDCSITGGVDIYLYICLGLLISVSAVYMYLCMCVCVWWGINLCGCDIKLKY